MSAASSTCVVCRPCGCVSGWKGFVSLYSDELEFAAWGISQALCLALHGVPRPSVTSSVWTASRPEATQQVYMYEVLFLYRHDTTADSTKRPVLPEVTGEVF